jgi:hypothetical protein
LEEINPVSSIQTNRSTKQTVFAWLGPILTFALLAGITWFLVWYWRGTTPSEATLTAEARAAEDASQPPPVAPKPRGPVGLTVPPLNIPGKGYIRTQSRTAAGATWGVFASTGQMAGAYLMTVSQPANSTDFLFSYSVKADAAYTGDDLQLISLAKQLVINPLDRMHSGVATDVVQQLSTQFAGGSGLYYPPMKMADADAQEVQGLWKQYSTSTGATHTAIGTSLLDALSVAGAKSLPANRELLAGTIVQVRKIIPADKEAAYLQGIQAAKAPPPPPRAAPAAAATTQP